MTKPVILIDCDGVDDRILYTGGVDAILDRMKEG